MTDIGKNSESSEKMVLRTVYLPPELDEKLRVSAFRAKVSKGDVIRNAIALALKADAPLEARGKPTMAKATKKRVNDSKTKQVGAKAKSKS
ncbi:ribbon-helix-helix protein, CopG family [Novosphingobium sp. BL-52-GroH]|uniref:ribbon-helix-helix protein, CopG family n=1 Tax=Novosphingobium sp. BL-52-GroH TaxID=3349877 RepID=UPI00384BAA1F